MHDVEEGQNLNDHPTTLSEVEHYYQEREQRLLEKLHQMDEATPQLGLRAFVWNIEQAI